MRSQGQYVDLLEKIIDRVNIASADRIFGQLQDIRKDLRGLKQRPSAVPFGEVGQNLDKDWPFAFHTGGRKELQFNLGLEKVDGQPILRYGVAFSLKQQQDVPQPIDLFAPKIHRFNEFFAAHPFAYSHLWMWAYSMDGRSSETRPQRIEPEWVTEGAFIFVGDRAPPSDIQVADILDTFDKLMPLYTFVEDEQKKFPDLLTGVTGDPTPEFRPGYTLRAEKPVTVAVKTDSLSRRHRHNQIGNQLYLRLRAEYGYNNVFAEQHPDSGAQADFVVRISTAPDRYSIYEIKPYESVRSCLREALGQVLDYGYWQDRMVIDRLIIVGPSEPEEDAELFLRTMRQRFNLPLFYECIERPGSPE